MIEDIKKQTNLGSFYDFSSYAQLNFAQPFFLITNHTITIIAIATISPDSPATSFVANSDMQSSALVIEMIILKNIYGVN